MKCLEDDAECGGVVEQRAALSATGMSFPRCDVHWARRLDVQEQTNRDYPDSPHAPAWFDSAFAGEVWDDE